MRTVGAALARPLVAGERSVAAPRDARETRTSAAGSRRSTREAAVPAERRASRPLPPTTARNASRSIGVDGSRKDGAHDTLPHQVHPIVAELAGIAVDEGQQITRRARAAGGREQPLELLELLAPPGGDLEARLRPPRPPASRPPPGRSAGWCAPRETPPPSRPVAGSPPASRTRRTARCRSRTRGADSRPAAADRTDRPGRRTPSASRSVQSRRPQQIIQRAHRLEGAAKGVERPVAAGVALRDRRARVHARSRLVRDLDQHGPAGHVAAIVEMGPVTAVSGAAPPGTRRTRWARSPR